MLGSLVGTHAGGGWPSGVMCMCCSYKPGQPSNSIHASQSRGAHLRVALPSATIPRRMSSNSFRDSCLGRSRQGLPSRRSLRAGLWSVLKSVLTYTRHPAA